jgi:hypothetical protein
MACSIYKSFRKLQEIIGYKVKLAGLNVTYAGGKIKPERV